MAEKLVAEMLIETLVAAGVKRIYGVVGDSLNGLLEEIQKCKVLERLVPLGHAHRGRRPHDESAHSRGHGIA
jgi:hypothetical protein